MTRPRTECAIARSLNELETLRENLPRPLAIVPTMGALHEGHLSLITKARTAGAKSVIVTIFVNPSQFAAGEDFATYPRTEAQDIELLAAAGVELVWLPTVETIYPRDFATVISLPKLSQDFEGQIRPNHFSGVATVVTRLLRLVRPELAVFGEKDYQQLTVIRHLVHDLALGVEVISAPTVRSTTGLALSSRNRTLSTAGLDQAASLSAALRKAAAALAEGAKLAPTLTQARAQILAAGFETVDYFDLVLDGTLTSIKSEIVPLAARPARLLTAARLEGVRLLDNWLVEGAP
ncbi:MAG: pantoate--beta-alanine ligase [Alphaproteobacteria bacterium]|nr:pantoate--beta-alanine ligase [Alphaproteobacteria bacterium]